jgi:DNA-binding transcriptional MerR regulator
MASEGIKKLYYSIGEVSDRMGLEAHVLRYWETEFEQLKPRKNRAGRRIYTAEDIAVVERIQHLLRVEKYTIEGARQVMGKNAVQRLPTSAQRRELMALRGFLESLLKRI